MSKTQMTSKERLLSAVRSGPVDHVPMSVSFWGNPRHARITWRNTREELAFYADRGWDTAVHLWCGIPPHPDVRGEVLRERDATGPILHQIWHTPAGDIHERLRVTDDWPDAQTATQCIGLLHDFRPARYVEVPFKTPADLAALPYLLPADVRDEQGLRRSIRDARRLADEFNVPLILDLYPGLDWLVWLYPAEEAVMRTIDSPDMIERILAQVHAAHRSRLKLHLEVGIDGIRRSGWYESASLWSPDLFRRLAVPELDWEIQAAKAAGAVFIYLMDSGVGPLLPDLNRLDLDCLKGIDPATAGGTDLAAIRRALPGKSIWGGISGPLHLGRGSPADAERAVEQAFAACGKTGFILGPAVGFRYNWPWENLEACDRAWRRLR